MARIFLTPIDMSQNQLLQAVLQNLAVAPATPVNGQLYYDTVLNSARVWTNGAWVNFGASIKKAAVTIGDGTTTAFVVTHNLNTQDVQMQVRQNVAPFSEVECDMAATTVNTSTFTFAVAPAANAYRVVIVG